MKWVNIDSSCVHNTTKGLVLKEAPQEWELLLNEICKLVMVDSSLFEERNSLKRVQDFCEWWGERGNGAKDTPPCMAYRTISVLRFTSNKILVTPLGKIDYFKKKRLLN